MLATYLSLGDEASAALLDLLHEARNGQRDLLLQSVEDRFLRHVVESEGRLRSEVQAGFLDLQTSNGRPAHRRQQGSRRGTQGNHYANSLDSDSHGRRRGIDSHASASHGVVVPINPLAALYH